MHGLLPHLAERCVERVASEIREDGEFVLYWAHHALRAHENPALEAAACIAQSRGLPLLVYQGLGGRHRYNADRHHRFILDSARDFDEQLRSLGLRLHFHLPREPQQAGPLAGLMARCAAAVSDLYPVPPFPDWYAGHAQRLSGAPFLLVDASCVLPMTASQREPTRAFQFRRKNFEEQHRRASTAWPTPGAWPAAFSGDVGFDPFDLSASLDDAIAACHIDHSIPPVADTPGGTAAGYRRWDEFLATGLADYHRLRNDAALASAVSRMSPYLHYGCVSPLRIAREALARGGEGADKFLDELLTWRDLSHHFCFHTTDLESLRALPEWAARTLHDHGEDPREATYDWETLARGRTDEPLWDLAQRSLLRRGELHNNVRMTWGKSFLRWAQRPQRALKLMIDLNHRFALDGSDPNSYGGLLWCLGQFDRPFPAAPIFGQVRQRSVKGHAKRLDMNAYARLVSRPGAGRSMSVAVVGAGLAGLTAARILDDQGHEVVVVDKGRGAGGRMSTRRDGDLRFDHGAQYFTARDPRFLRHVVAWRERGLVDAWQARIAVIGDGPAEALDSHQERFVALPGMSAVCSEIAGALPDCRFGWEAQAARFENGRWSIGSAGGDRVEAEALLLALPPEQARRLCPGSALDETLAGIRMLPCWAVMALFDRPLSTAWDAAFVNHGPLSWAASQAAKPSRPEAHAWVLHANPAWSLQHLEDEPGTVVERLLQAARDLHGTQPVRVESVSAHRWRYAAAEQPLEAGALFDGSTRLVATGDWCHGSRVEGAFLGGAAAAGRLMASVQPGYGR